MVVSTSSLWLRSTKLWERGDTFRCPGAVWRVWQWEETGHNIATGGGRAEPAPQQHFSGYAPPKNLFTQPQHWTGFTWESVRGPGWCRNGEGVAGEGNTKIIQSWVLVALLLIKPANISHGLANKPLTSDCRKLRAGVPGQVQLPQCMESYSGSCHFQLGHLLLPLSSSAPTASHLNSLRGEFTSQVKCLLLFQELLKQFVLSVGGMSRWWKQRPCYPPIGSRRAPTS